MAVMSNGSIHLIFVLRRAYSAPYTCVYEMKEICQLCLMDQFISSLYLDELIPLRIAVMSNGSIDLVFVPRRLIILRISLLHVISTRITEHRHFQLQFILLFSVAIHSLTFTSITRRTNLCIQSFIFSVSSV